MNNVLIFDMDGTLYHTDNFVDEYIEMLTDEVGMQQEMKNDYRSIMEEFSSEGLEQFHKDDMPLGDVWQVVRFISSKQDIPVDYQFDVFLKIREKMIEEKMIEVDDRLIHTIKKLNNPMVLMTNSPEESATPFIEYLGLNNIFDHHIYDAEKPSNMESHISEIRKLYPDHNIYKIGDNLTNDIHSSKALGLKTIYINHYNSTALNDVTVFSLEELNEYLNEKFTEA